jgi:hypothetical protein
MTKKITLDPKEIEVLEEAVKEKRLDVERDIRWRQAQGDSENKEKLIEKADALERIKEKLK